MTLLGIDGLRHLGDHPRGTRLFLQSGLPITVATRDDELQAAGAWAWALRVHPDRVHVSVFLYADAAKVMLRNLAAHPEIAAVIDRPIDHRACQVKGRFVSSRRAAAADRAEVERQRDGFLTELERIGVPRAVTAGWKYWPCVAIRFRATRLFEQTPGPGAGNRSGDPARASPRASRG